MSLPRFYYENNLPSSGHIEIQLKEAEIKHIHALRISSGEHIAIFNAKGTSWEVEFEALENSCLSANVLAKLSPESIAHLTLVQGISKGERMTQTIRQVTELGVERIIPFISKRCIVRLPKQERNKKGERFRSIAFAASKQCGRSFLPQLDDPLEIDELLKILPSFDYILLAWEDARESGTDIKEALENCTKNSKVALIIGPEGGFDKAEVAAIANACEEKLKTVSLGQLVLRTETAAVVACALCLHELGALGASK